jgi:hypothetical protein
MVAKKENRRDTQRRFQLRGYSLLDARTFHIDVSLDLFARIIRYAGGFVESAEVLDRDGGRIIVVAIAVNACNTRLDCGAHTAVSCW